ncbi:MAG TPA: FAD-dependent oxidoreductase, partial [Methylomirabilota bacterium]|nr:FAD-dependent oxidoreductase [Methylomirabilota bacterium]
MLREAVEGAVERVLVQPWDVHNQALVRNVHPAEWANPKPAGRYNLVVIGAGTAGLVTAAGAAGLGARVALVERDLMGGDCLNVGCVPSKALIRAARAWADVRDAGEFGVAVPGAPRATFSAVMERMRRLRAGISGADSAWRLMELGVDVFFGSGRFGGPDSVEVAGTTLRFRKAVIATGARAAAPAVPGLAETGYLTNETVFGLTALPRRLAVIGGGPIGCELAQAFARFGAAVTLLQRQPQILVREDRDAAERIQRALVRDGVRLVLDCRVERAQRDGEDRLLHLVVRGPAGDGRETVRVDAILVAAGRAPNVDALGLEAVGVAVDRDRGVRVDDHLRTTNPRIYAAGDVCSARRFTHHAD